MITRREMKQLFQSISGMQTLNINGFDQIGKLATLKLVATFCEEVPNIECEHTDGNVVWTLTWPIPLTDVDNGNDNEKGLTP